MLSPESPKLEDLLRDTLPTEFEKIKSENGPERFPLDPTSVAPEQLKKFFNKERLPDKDEKGLDEFGSRKHWGPQIEHLNRSLMTLVKNWFQGQTNHCHLRWASPWLSLWLLLLSRRQPFPLAWPLPKPLDCPF